MNIHKEVYGTGDPIVLLHGWAMHTGVWREFAKKLAQNYQVICLDLPSHGRSDYLEKFTLENISAALIEQFPSQACTVLGWSMGVTIALDLSQRFPQRINGLIGLAGNPCFVAQENWAGMKLTLLRQFNQQLIDDCSGTLLRFLSLQILRQADYKILVKQLKLALNETLPPTQSILEQGLILLETTDLRMNLATINCPVLMVLGDRDTLVPIKVGEQLQTLQPKLLLKILPKAGHVPFLSHPEELLDCLRNFMEQKRVD